MSGWLLALLLATDGGALTLPGPDAGPPPPPPKVDDAAVVRDLELLRDMELLQDMELFTPPTPDPDDDE